MMTIVFGMVLPWLLIGIGTWLAHELVRQNGRILLRLEAIEKQIGPRAEGQRREAGGLPLGTLAPDFELPDLRGVRRKLSEFRQQNVLLMFFNPQCGFCTGSRLSYAAATGARARGGTGRCVGGGGARCANVDPAGGCEEAEAARRKVDQRQTAKEASKREGRRYTDSGRLQRRGVNR